MRDKNQVSFKVHNNYYLKGEFFGKYQSEPKQTKNNLSLSSITLLESSLVNAQRCDFSEVMKVPEVNFDIKKMENFEITLADLNIPNEYVFVEDVHNIKISNIKLENQISEGKYVLGVIKGDIICCLISKEEVEYINDSLPIPDLEIVLPKISKFKAVKNYIRLFINKKKNK